MFPSLAFRTHARNDDIKKQLITQGKLKCWSNFLFCSTGLWIVQMCTSTRHHVCQDADCECENRKCRQQTCHMSNPQITTLVWKKPLKTNMNLPTVTPFCLSSAQNPQVMVALSSYLYYKAMKLIVTSIKGQNLQMASSIYTWHLMYVLMFTLKTVVNRITTS